MLTNITENWPEFLFPNYDKNWPGPYIFPRGHIYSLNPGGLDWGSIQLCHKNFSFWSYIMFAPIHFSLPSYRRGLRPLFPNCQMVPPTLFPSVMCLVCHLFPKCQMVPEGASLPTLFPSVMCLVCHLFPKYNAVFKNLTTRHPLAWPRMLKFQIWCHFVHT